ncbi:LD-carboxypeptidase [Sphingopyxis sp. BSNA05]|uniref:LD-carboxypeptidase n=1 Tax=Sphingopyxis sp. BSNA05 TaxID=1236614 RepID=UPI00349FBF5F
MALAARTHPQAELVFAEQCFSEQGHFAGSDTQRTDSFVSLANDPDIDAIWFARGGYGAARIAEAAVQRLNDVAHRKIYLGYSDAGNLLGALYRAGIGQVAHGPMPSDIGRTGGEEAVVRSLDWIVHRLAHTLEPGLVSGQKYAAFNLMTLAMMTGTKLIPDLHGHILIIEEISEYLYAFDRAMFHLCSNLAGQGLAGIRLGGVDDIPETTGHLAKVRKLLSNDGPERMQSPIWDGQKSAIMRKTGLCRSDCCLSEISIAEAAVFLD